MKRSTSWPSSRKYSAIVSPDSADAQARARRLVHLPVDERDLVEHARLLHLEPEVVALARALADAGEHGDAAVLRARRCGSAPGSGPSCRAPAPPKRPTLPPFTNGAIRSMTLMPGLEDLDLRREVAERRRVAVDRPALGAVGNRALLVDRLADDVPEAAERRRHRPERRSARRCRRTSAPRDEAVGRVHRDGADAVVAEVLLHLRDQRARRAVLVGDVDLRGPCRSRAGGPGRRRR